MSTPYMHKAPSLETALNLMITKIDRIVADQDYRAEDEDPPSPAASNRLKEIVRLAYENSGPKLPIGDVSSFYGEMSVTWILGTKKLRVDVGADGIPRMHFGSFELEPKKRYSHESVKEDATLLAKVKWLVGNQDALTEHSFR